MKFSSKGYYGTAIYFAQNASYSDNGYYYKLPSGDRQLFLAEVLLGDYDPASLAQDPALRRPPKKSANSDERFDSVKGNTQGSDVYMVYQTHQAYPRYLITYMA